ncbi:MAG: hypothetical protein ACXACC_02110 [Promethearchaeota archaeon]|jgi:hypothetical protein
MKKQENEWDIPYHEAFFKTSHNSYARSIREQLDKGVRGLEYDIHDDKIRELNDFEVYLFKDYYDVMLNADGNPSDYLFSNWLSFLREWSNKHDSEHAPITLFIELKDNIIDSNNKSDDLYGIGKLNEIIMNSITLKKLYTYKNFRGSNYTWPTVGDLKGKILIVLTSYWGGSWVSNEGGFESRLEYLSRSLESKDDICFVSWVEEDKGDQALFLKENTYFWKCGIDYSKKKYEEIKLKQRLTRVDYDKVMEGKHVKTYYNKNYKNGYRCNFPSTDSWNTELYDNSFPWSI